MLPLTVKQGRLDVLTLIHLGLVSIAELQRPSPLSTIHDTVTVLHRDPLKQGAKARDVGSGDRRSVLVAAALRAGRAITHGTQP